MSMKRLYASAITLCAASTLTLWAQAQTSVGYVLPPVTAGALSQSPLSAARVLHHVEFRADSWFDPSSFQRFASDYLHRPLQEWQIEELRQGLTRLLIDQGMVNSGVVLPADAWQVHEGEQWKLTLQVVTGRVHEIRIRGLQDLDESYLRERLWPRMEAPLQMSRLRESYQLLLENPLFEQIHLQVMPGEQAGQAVLDIEVKRAPAQQWSLFANNYSAPSIGANAFGVRGVVRNLTGRGDALQLSWQAPPERTDAARALAQWRVPVGGVSRWMELQLEQGQSAVVEEPARWLNIQSQIKRVEWGWGVDWSESLRQKISAGVQASYRWNQTTLGGMPYSFLAGQPDGRTELYTTRFWQEITRRDVQEVWTLRSTLALSHSNQPVDLRALPAGQSVPPPSYAFWQGQGQYLRQISESGMQWILKGAAQWSQATLLSLDRLAIGGNASIRGYRENQLVRDRGLWLSLALDVPVSTGSTAFKTMRWGPFVDSGWGQNRGESATRITSAGLSWRARWNAWQMELSRGWMLDRLPASTGPRQLQDQGLHFQLSRDF